MREPIQVTVIGGSACSAFALENELKAWPEILDHSIDSIKITSYKINNLTLVRSISIIDKIPMTEVLIFHFGTSVAWPTSIVNLGQKFGFGAHNEVALHQPPHPYSGSQLVRLKKYSKLRFRNLVKYLLFFAGLYRPKNSIRELADQVQAVLNLAEKKAAHIIWIQHRSLPTFRIFLERKTYTRFYKRLINSVTQRASSQVHLFQLPTTFMQNKNFLADGVHLSETGHKTLAFEIGRYLLDQQII